MKGRNPLHHTPSQQPDETPVALPHVVITVTENGALNVTVDGTPFPSPSAGSEWTRGTFGPLLDAVTHDRTVAVRIEVREVDGTVFTDIITPSRRRAVPEPPGRPAAPAPLPVLYGDGFVPGEDVAIAVVIAHGDAAPDGTMRGLIEAAQLAASPTREVILLGRVSGTVTIGHPE